MAYDARLPDYHQPGDMMGMLGVEWSGRHTHFSLRGRDAALGLGGDEEAPRHDADPADPAALLAISGDETPPFAPPGGGALAPAPGRAAVLLAASPARLAAATPVARRGLYFEELELDVLAPQPVVLSTTGGVSYGPLPDPSGDAAAHVAAAAHGGIGRRLCAALALPPCSLPPLPPAPAFSFAAPVPLRRKVHDADVTGPRPKGRNYDLFPALQKLRAVFDKTCFPLQMLGAAFFSVAFAFAFWSS